MQDEITAARRKKRRKIKARRLGRFLAAMAVLCVCALLLSTVNAATFKDAGDFFRTVFAFGGSYPCALGSSSPIQAEQMSMAYAVVTQDEFLVVSQGGKVLLDEEHGFVEPALTASGNRAVLYNRESRDVRVYNRSAKVAELKTDFSIVDCALAGNGDLAVLTGSDLYTCQMTVYKNGKYGAAMTWKGASGFPLRAAMSDNGGHAAVATLDTENGSIKSTITSINIGKEKEGWSTAVDGIVLKMLCGSDGSVTAVSDTGAYHLTSAGEVKYTYSYAGTPLVSVACDTGSRIALGFGDNSRSAVNRIVLLGSRLTESAVIEDCGEIKDMYLASSRLYLLGSDAVTVCGMNGNVTKLLSADPRAMKIVAFASIIEILPDRADRLTETVKEESDGTAGS